MMGCTAAMMHCVPQEVLWLGRAAAGARFLRWEETLGGGSAAECCDASCRQTRQCLLPSMLTHDCALLLQHACSLNAANALAADALLLCGLGRLAPTHDLNAAQIQASVAA